MSIPAPNYTPIPNVILDEWMKHLSLIQFKVLIAICRKTFGWHKARDRISLTQLTEMTGCSRDKVSEALKWLCSKNIITKLLTGTNGQQQALYSINVSADSNNLDQSPMATPPSSLGLPTKERAKQNEVFEAETQPELRKDIANLDFEPRDKQLLSKYPTEAIAYAKRCLSRMRVTPDKPIAVFVSLCEKYITSPNLSTERPKKNGEEGVPRAAKNKVTAEKSLEKLAETKPGLRNFVSIGQKAVTFTVDGKNYVNEYSSKTFIEDIKTNFEVLYDKA